MTSNLKPKTSNLIFLGTPEISVIILKALLENGYNVGSVVTRPDKPKGRGQEVEKSPVKVLAEKEGIRVFQPQNKPELEEYVKKEQPDLLIVCAFGMIITKETLDVPKHGAINVHPSLLPKYRGPAPISAPILNGDKKTGTTIMLMNEKMDEGDILSQKEIKLTGEETAPELEETLANLSADLLAETLPKWLAGKIKPQKQNDRESTYTKMVAKEDGKIDFETDSAEEIERKSRAFQPWPGIYSDFNGKKLDLFDIGTLQGTVPCKGQSLAAGQMQTCESKLLIGTKTTPISPAFVKLEGKNRIPATDFIRGYLK